MAEPSVGGAPRPERTADRAPTAWRTDFLSAFVVLSLLATLLMPIAVQRRVHDLRDEIEHAADPARTLVTEIQYLLARQTSVLRGYFITGDESFLQRFEEFARQEDSVYAELTPLVDRLGAPVLGPFVELRTLSREWHERLDEEEIALGIAGASAEQVELPFEQPIYLSALESAARLDLAIASATQTRRQAIARVERTGYAVNLVLALLAVAAAVSVAHLSYGHRVLARKAELRRLAAEAALDQQLHAVDARARLIRGVTHDVKNPLGAADAYAELLQLGLRGPLTPDQLDFLAKMRRSIRAALEIIHDLLDLGGAESGGLQLERAPTEIVRLAADVVDDHRAAAERADHSLTLRAPPELPVLLTDPVRVRQVLGNLLSNALKYTPPPGRIEVSVELVESTNSPTRGAWVAVRVVDSGPGVPPESRESVFDEFSRLHSGAVQGHGLGLAISRRIARLLNGDVTLTDARGGGAEFTLWLPVESRAVEKPVDVGAERLG